MNLFTPIWLTALGFTKRIDEKKYWVICIFFATDPKPRFKVTVLLNIVSGEIKDWTFDFFPQERKLPLFSTSVGVCSNLWVRLLKLILICLHNRYLFFRWVNFVWFTISCSWISFLFQFSYLVFLYFFK